MPPDNIRIATRFCVTMLNSRLTQTSAPENHQRHGASEDFPDPPVRSFRVSVYCYTFFGIESHGFSIESPGGLTASLAFVRVAELTSG